MSTDSLIETTYESLDEVCRLIDRIVLTALAPSSQPPAEALDVVARVLAPPRDETPTLNALIIDCLLRSATGEDLVDRRQIAKNLLDCNLDEATLADLKFAGDILNEERARTVHRLMRR